MAGRPQEPDELVGDIVAVASPAPGGTLREYVEFLRGCGQTCLLSTEGKHAWISEMPGVLERFPGECTDPVNPAELREAFSLRGMRIVNYNRTVDGDHPPTCFDYICRNPEYHIDGLDSNARRDIRRGLRSFVVRLCSWDELAEHGYAPHADTFERHQYAPPPPGGIRRYVEERRGTPFFDIWGAWEGETLAAWLAVIKVDDWAVVHWANSSTAALRNCPNNAMLYVATRRLLVDEKRVFVSYGLSSVQAGPTHLGLHKYKVRMGYEAIPRHRVFVPRPLVGLLLKPKVASWMWDRMERIFPKSPFVRKVAGVSRLLAGRERVPLGWAEEKTGKEET